MSVRDGSGEGLELGIEVLRGLRRADGAEGYLLQLGEGLGAQRGGALAPVGGIQVHVAGLDVQVVGVLEVVVHRGVEALDGRDQAQLLLVQLEALVGGQEGEELLRGLSLSPEILLLMPKAGSMEPGAYGVSPFFSIGIWPKP